MNSKLNPIQWHINMLTHQEVCANPCTAHSPPRGMCPLRLETILGSPQHSTLFIPFQTICYFHSHSQPLVSSTIFATCNQIVWYILKITFIPSKLPSSILFTSTTCLQSWDFYSTMGRTKLTPNVTPNTLEFMNTLISSILDRICDMTKKPFEYPRNNT